MAFRLFMLSIYLDQGERRPGKRPVQAELCLTRGETEDLLLDEVAYPYLRKAGNPAARGGFSQAHECDAICCKVFFESNIHLIISGISRLPNGAVAL